MLLKKTFRLLTGIILFFGCSEPQSTPEHVLLIPKPQSVEMLKGAFVIDDATGIAFPDEFRIGAEFLTGFIRTGTNGVVDLIPAEEAKILFIKDSSIDKAGAYKLHIENDRINIYSGSPEGAFYAVQTLRQLLPVELENGSYKLSKLEVPCLKIADYPRFSYRGMHLDVGRHMFPVAFIKKYIDALAMLKMNKFHWHLTEDQGWRIEIKSYPKLNEIAAFRNETLIGHYSDQPHQFDGMQYGGFYTQEEVKEIVAYAAERMITVIPEIEMPGHSQAAIAAYPKLGCMGEPVEVATTWGVFEDIYCTKEETFEFLENVLQEVIALFPSEYIHIGGDEAPKTNWKACSNCQNRIQEQGLEDEHELQSYFITRMESFLNSKGRQIIGWDEILEGGLAPNATVMSWRGTSGAVNAANENHKVILSPTSHCYFDYYQSEAPGEPLAIGGYLPLEKVYAFDPIPEELPESKHGFVIGAQGNVWTEYMPNSEQVEYMVFPRILAMSEVVWTEAEHKEIRDFVKRVEIFNNRLDVLGINYANHLYELEWEIVNLNGENFFKIETKSGSGEIRYTRDGSEPNSESKLYDGPIPVSPEADLRIAVFSQGKKQSDLEIRSVDAVFHKAMWKEIELNVEPHKAYSEGGKEALLNGIPGNSGRYGDKEWLGFWGDDLRIKIDMGEVTDISSVSTRFYNSPGQWIHAPDQVELVFDSGQKKYTVDLNPDSGKLVSMEFNETLSARFIELIVPNYGIIPEGYQGAGNKAWTFIDEIVVQ